MVDQVRVCQVLTVIRALIYVGLALKDTPAGWTFNAEEEKTPVDVMNVFWSSFWKWYTYF